MKTMAVSEFKAHALKVLDQVAKTRQPVLITKRGKPLAEVVPCTNHEEKPQPDTLADTVIHIGDIVSPLGEDMWDACR